MAKDGIDVSRCSQQKGRNQNASTSIFCQSYSPRGKGGHLWMVFLSRVVGGRKAHCQGKSVQLIIQSMFHIQNENFRKN